MIDLGINLFQEIAALGGGGGFSITNSLRFNDNDSAYLSRTPSVAGDRKTWTWSGWVKRGNLGTTQYIFYAHGSNSDSGNFQFRFETDNSIKVRFYTNTDVFTTSAVLRDVAGWYHLVLVVDTTQSTANDRIKIYVNGVQAAKGSGTAPTLNADLAVNDSVLHTLGSNAITVGSATLDGYMAEVNFIDGQALTPDSFGQIDASTGEWSPKAYSGTYGTNGFYLPFSGNANDSSGNGNNWTENNLASTDYMIDTPTNNFCTLNPLDTGGGSVTLSDGNLNYAIASSTGAQVRGTLGTGLSSKWYWEFTNGTTATPFTPVIFGISTLDGQITNNSTSLRLAAYIYTDGGINNVAALTVNGSTSSPIQTQFRSAAVSDVLQVAYDADTGKLWFGKNNVWYDAVDTTTGNPSAGLNPVFTMPTGSAMTPFLLNIGGSYSGFLNCGQRPFAYTPPTGYLALCTDNLPAPAIEQPETQFNVVTYTGDGTTNRAITGVGFQPDFVWYKDRTSVNNHHVFDSVRGAGNYLFTSATNAEATDTNRLTSFNADGFTIGSQAGTNYNGNNYVAWCWKAGGTAVTNTNGTITSQVSANVDAGFSIVSYTGNSTSGATIGHGLNLAPEVVIAKTRAIANSWHVYTKSTGAANVLLLDSTAALYTSNSVWWNNTDPNSTVVTLGSGTGTNSSSAMIAYCFHSVEGFSKFGTYTGNGSADGPFIYTGFRPAFVMFKCTSQAPGSWIIHDTARNPENVSLLHLRANTNGADDSGANESIDILSNGFKHRGVSNYNANASGQTYIYIAFAEAPLKNSLAR